MILTGGNKGGVSKPKKYRDKKFRNKPSLETETETDFQGQCTELEGYTFDLGSRASEKNCHNNEGTGVIPWNNIK